VSGQNIAPEITKSQKYLLSSFQVFQKPISYELAASLSHLSMPQINNLAALLIKNGWLTEQGGYLELGSDIPATAVRSFVQLNNEKRIAEILQAVRSHGFSCHRDVLAVLDLLWTMGEIEDAVLLAWNSISARIKERQYEEALETSAWVSSRLEVILEHNELWSTVIDLALTFNRLDFSFKKYHVETVKALELILEPCRRLGDERRLALVLLHLSRRYISLNNFQKSSESFHAGFKIVKRLGDRDIERQAAPFYATYYSHQGLTKKATIRFQRIGYPDLIENTDLPDPQIVVTACINAVMSGEFHIAIGSLNANWRRAVLNGENGLANTYRAYLGQVLLMKGLMDEAILHLDAALADTDPREEAFVHFVILRAKAYYLLLQGRMREAYEMLCGGVMKWFQQGWHRFYWGFPWVLEMLYYFHRAGYPPIPHYEYEAEIESALTGQNIQSRAVALRIRADEATEEGNNPKIVRDLLKDSEKYLSECGNPAELAKTRAQLALWYIRQGDQIKARQLAQQAWKARHSLGNQQLPSEISSLAGDAADALPEMIHGLEILSRLLDMVDGWQFCENQQEMFQQVISNTTRFFCAERGAIVLIEGHPDKQRPVVCAGCNLSLEDMEEGDLQICFQQAKDVIQSNRPLIIRELVAANALRMQGVKSALCIPFNLSDTKGILYYDTLHIDQAFDWCDSAMLSRITESIRSYVRRTLEFTQHLNQHQSLAIPAITQSSEKESGVFITSGRLFQNVLKRADRASLSDAPVLILGETGVGKEVIAKRVHLMSKRRDMPFIAVNLASIPETLLESELFGHEKGAFTGADRQKLGRLELANKGTLFIDEVGDIPKFVQVKLLRALEEMSFVRIGGMVKRDVDFRLIAATNRDLAKEVEAGNFRADLFYRLNVIPIFIPPLRERGDDAVELAQKFLEKSAKKYRLPVRLLSPEDKEWIKSYHWPGNIRELRNVMERAVIMHGGPLRPSNPLPELIPTTKQNGDFLAGNLTMDEMQRRLISRVMEETNQNLAQAAVILGMKRTTLYKRMVKLGIR